MLNISKPLSASQAQTYHAKEFTAAEQNYWKQGDTIQGEWHGKLADEFGLSGTVGAAEFARLSEGQHPETGKQLVSHRVVHEYKNSEGKTVSPVEHRAGWDATFSAPKSISLTALVGGDDRVREAHREAVNVALNELEKYTQARIGGNNPAETTGKFAAAKFEHDTARPVDGYAAPQLHTHVVVFNMTERDNGAMRALQPHSLFESQQFATAVYQSHLTYKLRDLGYEIEAGKSGAPDVKGFTAAYLEASSPRRQQIEEALGRSGFTGPEAAQIAAHNTRDKKVILSPAEILAAHKQIADEFGNQAERVVAAARQRRMEQTQERLPNERQQQVREAVTFARDKGFEREAVVDERALYVDALRRGMGEMTYPEVRASFEARIASGEFKQITDDGSKAGRRFTTATTIKAESEIVQKVRDGQSRAPQIMGIENAVPLVDSRPHFNAAQKRVVEEVLTSYDRVQGLQGRAGSGKTSVLATIREGAERNGYAVEGFAPTSRAAKQLRDAGIQADTLQRFLAGGGLQVAGGPARKHLYMVDESSLASTQQMRDFLNKIAPQDKVLLIGDTRQHQGVDAGKPFEQMQEAGMRMAQLDQIMRQKDPDLLKAVEHLSNNETALGVEMLQHQGRITQIEDPQQRITAIAKDYAAHPESTLIVSPDNASRRAINQAVRQELQALGVVDKTDHSMRVLAPRNDMTGADREWAARYQPGDVLHYVRGSKEHGIEARSYAQVVTTNAPENLVTVRKVDGQQVTYDPSRLRGVAAYREIEREFAIGDRVQLTAPNRDLQVANRDLGTLENFDDAGRITLLMDSGKNVSFDPREMRHFDHGYAVTSHSSQGLTSARVLVNIDTQVHPELINGRFAYVSVSRASQDVQIFTNDAANLAENLSHDASKTSALPLVKTATVIPDLVREQNPVTKTGPSAGLSLAL
ncbi:MULTISPECIES: MobF family relaxase [Acidobacterium]|uniref:Conjugative relaxase domain protein n=1 Tax=Acidobacterium capsulatum (strain ATCC 51196 / DSM 11244 / BCRC 80197 / JCM 7670 / NBRC 15755 / NCIMB 13165 / 161) TaxID=240015 RepID=C1F5K2_ACIC5|nr:MULTISPECIES: MobF family relaxase [Acidobacterium]ACO33202.1 conjugative relaxase domain protein [Acidobacterium capsulatum ATCC 51196]HCT61206.1 conjugative relaxase [Acidobacterium sp.]